MENAGFLLPRLAPSPAGAALSPAQTGKEALKSGKEIVSYPFYIEVIGKYFYNNRMTVSADRPAGPEVRNGAYQMRKWKFSGMARKRMAALFMALIVLFSLPVTAASGEETVSGGSSLADNADGGAASDTRTALKNAFEEWKIALYIVGFTALSGVTFWSIFLLVERRKDARRAERNISEKPEGGVAETGVLKKDDDGAGDAQPENPGRTAK